MSTTERDWNQAAASAAKYMSENAFEAHRGAIPWAIADVTAIFGNDCYLDEAGNPNYLTADLVRRVRGRLAEGGIEELGFGTTGDGYSWVILARHKNAEGLGQMVWGEWVAQREGVDPGAVLAMLVTQAPIAAQAVDRLAEHPELN